MHNRIGSQYIMTNTTENIALHHKTYTGGENLDTSTVSHPKHISEVVSVDVFHAALGFIVRKEVRDP